MRRPVDPGLLRHLDAAPAFAACDRADLTALARAGQVVSLPARWTFVHERTPADACYVVLAGRVQVVAGGAVLAELGAGAVVGEMALLGRSLRRASVVTSTTVQVLHLDYGALAALAVARPRLAEALGAVYREHVTASA